MTYLVVSTKDEDFFFPVCVHGLRLCQLIELCWFIQFFKLVVVKHCIRFCYCGIQRLSKEWLIHRWNQNADVAQDLGINLLFFHDINLHCMRHELHSLHTRGDLVACEFHQVYHLPWLVLWVAGHQSAFCRPHAAQCRPLRWSVSVWGPTPISPSLGIQSVNLEKLCSFSLSLLS